MRTAGSDREAGRKRMTKLTKADWRDIHNPKPGAIARSRKNAGPTLVATYKRTRAQQWAAGMRHIEAHNRLVAKLGEKEALTLIMALDDEVRG